MNVTIDGIGGIRPRPVGNRANPVAQAVIPTRVRSDMATAAPNDDSQQPFSYANPLTAKRSRITNQTVSTDAIISVRNTMPQVRKMASAAATGPGRVATMSPLLQAGSAPGFSSARANTAAVNTLQLASLQGFSKAQPLKQSRISGHSVKSVSPSSSSAALASSRREGAKSSAHRMPSASPLLQRSSFGGSNFHQQSSPAEAAAAASVVVRANGAVPVDTLQLAALKGFAKSVSPKRSRITSNVVSSSLAADGGGTSAARASTKVRGLPRTQSPLLQQSRFGGSSFKLGEEEASLSSTASHAAASGGALQLVALQGYKKKASSSPNRSTRASAQSSSSTKS